MRGIVYSTIYTVYTARANPVLFSVLYINYTHTCICVCMCVCMCVCVYVYVCVYVCMCMCLCVCMCVYVYVYVCVYVFMCLYVIIGNNTLYGYSSYKLPDNVCTHSMLYK